ncbi:MAG: hypothetical protein L6R28_25710, partial [Planctomycetes bacterium]|nr:hypothetical protein [Planctomycetota bacterium]
AISKEDKSILTCSAEYVSLEPGTPDSVDPSLVLECIESDIGTGKKLAHKEMIARSGEVFQSLAYTAGQRRATFSTWHRTVLWDAGTGANVVTFEGAGYPVPDGKRILLFRPGELLQIGDVDTGEILTTLEGTANAEAPDVSMAPDGNHILLLVGGRGNEAQVWERRRDEGPWGIAALPESWLTALFALLLVWSLVRDFRTLRKVAT